MISFSHTNYHASLLPEIYLLISAKFSIFFQVAKSTINQVKSSNENEVKYIELRRIIVINEMTKLMRNLIIYLL
jgi:hypothetical protein